MKRRYHFITEIRLSSAPQEVWDTLARADKWPTWWRWLEEATVLYDGDDEGVGRTVHNKVSSPLRYRLSYVGTATRVDEPRLLEFSSVGQLQGTGLFQLEGDGSGSHLLFNWLVETSRPWMNLLAPLAKPVFAWNHHRLMTDFAEGLATATGGHLRQVSHWAVNPDEEGFYRLPA